MRVLGRKDNLPMPKPWDTCAIDSPEVKRAYLSFVLRAVDTMHPDYLAIGMENNVLLSHGQAKWKQLKALHVATYTAVKAKHPKLPVFFTTEVLHYKLSNEAHGADQEGEVAELMKHSDLFAMSVYPHMSFAVPRPVPESFFNFARSFGKPMAVSESGDTSRDVKRATRSLNRRLPCGMRTSKRSTRGADGNGSGRELIPAGNHCPTSVRRGRASKHRVSPVPPPV